jgi:hypothetical protein
MTLNWKDTKAYQGHLEDMREFCRLHEKQNPVEDLQPRYDALKDRPEVITGPANIFTDANGKLIIVPIWRTVMVKGSQN